MRIHSRSAPPSDTLPSTTRKILNRPYIMRHQAAKNKFMFIVHLPVSHSHRRLGSYRMWRDSHVPNRILQYDTVEEILPQKVTFHTFPRKSNCCKKQITAFPGRNLALGSPGIDRLHRRARCGASGRSEGSSDALNNGYLEYILSAGDTFSVERISTFPVSGYLEKQLRKLYFRNFSCLFLAFCHHAFIRLFIILGISKEL